MKAITKEEKVFATKETGTFLTISTKQEKGTKDILKTRTAELTERIKELNCLYGISNLFETQGASLPWILQRAVELIPAAWQYSENACARILLNNHVFNTKQFKETSLKQSTEIVVNGKIVGRVEVFYSNTKSAALTNLFLDEEKRLLNAISERLSKIIWLKQSEEYLKESEKRYRIVTEQVAEGVTILQNDRFYYVNPAFCGFFGLKHSEAIIGKPVSVLKMETAKDIGAILKSFPNKDCIEKNETVLSFVDNDRTRWLQVCHSPITLKGIPAILSTFKDVTEIKTEQLAASRKAESLHQENLVLKSTLKDRYRFGDLIGKSLAMQKVYELILKAAKTDASVVIFGESGTGKELVARAIHMQDILNKSRFVAVNCGAIQETLFEREFFGHCKGAFSGAHADTPGFLDMAKGGTLFLDEIGELTTNMQVKLLRAIEGGGYCPVGSNKPRFSDFRLVSASNRPLVKDIRDGRMRDDFFFRIQVIQINLPSLRERKEDIPLLVEHFLKTKQHCSRIASIPSRFLDRLIAYDWPGNVRELKNVLQRYETLDRLEFFNPHQSISAGEELMSLKIGKEVELLEKSLISKALERAGGNQTNAAKMLGISRRTLFRKIKTYGMTKSPVMCDNAHIVKHFEIER